MDSDEVADGVVLDYDINGAVVGIDLQRATQQSGSGSRQEAGKCVYRENDDILEICLSDKPVVREMSPDWHTNISYAEDGTIVEIVLLDSKKAGLLPLEFRNAA